MIIFQQYKIVLKEADISSSNFCKDTAVLELPGHSRGGPSLQKYTVQVSCTAFHFHVLTACKEEQDVAGALTPATRSSLYFTQTAGVPLKVMSKCLFPSRYSMDSP